MENRNVSLPEQQALLSAPKISENTIYVERPESLKKKADDAEQMKKSAEWFRSISVGSLLYAIIYACCMYRNTEGITFPFCVGATLYFFWYYAKKFLGTVRKCDRFLMIAVVLLGMITCTTDSDVIIYFNKLAIFVLMGVYLLELFYDVTGWSFAAFAKAGCCVLFCSIGYMVVPFEDGKAFWKLRKQQSEKAPIDEKKKQKYIAIAVGAAISIPMLFVIVLLLSSADAFFRELFVDIFDTIFSWETPELFNRRLFGFIGTIVVIFLLGYGTITYISHKNSIEEAANHKSKQWNAYIAITFSSMIGVVYVLFAAIQILGLFLGALKLPEGYTYAGYAREGFFQLAFICFFNICLVLICTACFEESKVLKGIMLILCACTYIMLVSSAYRMILYIKVYHLTFLRLLVLWALGIMAVVMVGIIAFIFRRSFPIFRYLLVTITAFYIGFAAAHPDYWIAKYNIAQAQMGKDVDEYYLILDLSLDAAVPILEFYENEIVNGEKYYDEHWGEWLPTSTTERVWEYLDRIERNVEDMNWRTYNISKAIAWFDSQKYVDKRKPVNLKF